MGDEHLGCRRPTSLAPPAAATPGTGASAIARRHASDPGAHRRGRGPLAGPAAQEPIAHPVVAAPTASKQHSTHSAHARAPASPTLGRARTSHAVRTPTPDNSARCCGVAWVARAYGAIARAACRCAGGEPSLSPRADAPRSFGAAAMARIHSFDPGACRCTRGSVTRPLAEVGIARPVALSTCTRDVCSPPRCPRAWQLSQASATLLDAAARARG